MMGARELYSCCTLMRSSISLEARGLIIENKRAIVGMGFLCCASGASLFSAP